MGNRCQVYLTNDNDTTYIVSRNGFKIYLSNEIKEYLPILRDAIPFQFEMCILDAELLPWRILGESLIDRQFYGFGELIQNENQFLIESKYKDAVAKIFDEDFLSISDPSEDEMDKFMHQVDLYGNGQISKPFIRVFDVLKHIHHGEENVVTNSAFWFDYFGQQYRIYTKDTTYSKTIVDKMFQEYEGVVIKPTKIVDGVAPYLKCRNPEYLRIIYGPDYLQEEKYKKLYGRKNIKNKLSRSIYEWKLGMKMLNTSINNLNTQEYMGLLNEFFCSNQALDPRL
jgi:hypothetical protein